MWFVGCHKKCWESNDASVNFILPGGLGYAIDYLLK